MATSEDIALLRRRIGERIPDAGTEADTMFTDVEVTAFIDEASGNLDTATLLAWEAKAAELANLVNVQEGASRRDLGSLHKQALDQVKHWRDVSAGSISSGSGTRIKDITRS